MNRRTFATRIGQGLAALSLAPLLTTTACSFSSVYAEMLKYVPLGLSAVASVVAILTGNGIAISPTVNSALTLIKAAFADLQTAIQQYQDASQGQKSSLIGQIAEGLTVAEANIQQFWNDLSIPDPKLSALIEGLLGVVTTTLMGFASQLPQAQTVPAAQARTMRAALAKHLPDSPVKRTPRKFRSDFNATLSMGGEGTHAI